MNKNKIFSKISMPIVIAICSMFTICDYADAARAAVRAAPVARKNVAATRAPTTTNTVQNGTESIAEPEPAVEEPIVESVIIENKSNQFDTAVSSVMESATEDNTFAEQIRKQRAALAASEASSNASSAQRNAMATNSSTCDSGLRKCMSETCGKDFTKCALDGDTIFGDKLNKCRRDIECTGEEFSLFSTEIRADRDMNVRLASYNAIIECGNSYNACIMNECGTTYGKCLGKSNADAAIQKCATIAKNCTESDSGLASRFGTAIGKLRETAESEVKADEKRLYTLRDNMRTACESMGARFDDRSFDCVYTVNFFAGNDQTTPTASRKRYAGDTFVCMQEWFGINATTYKENAYRETRAQTAASSAMLGSGVGTAVGLVTSGAIGRSLDTQKAKKELDKEKHDQGMLTDREQRKADRAEKRAERKEERAQKKAGKDGEDSGSPGGGSADDETIRKAAEYDRMKNELDTKANEDLKKADKDNDEIRKTLDESIDKDLEELGPKKNEGLARAKAMTEEERDEKIKARPPTVPTEEEDDDPNVKSMTQEELMEYQTKHPQKLESKATGVNVQDIKDQKLDMPKTNKPT